MKIRFWGTRGSIPTPYPDFMKYGGNTSCVEIRTRENQLIILDAGTGLRRLGLKLLKESKFKQEEIEQIVESVIPGEVSQQDITLPPHLSFLKGDEPYVGKALIFLTHTHWDHIQGFPFFVPAFLSGREFSIYSLYKVDYKVLDSFKGQMGYTYFPVIFEQLSSKIGFIELVEETFRAENVIVKTRRLHHPQGALGYRITSGEVTIVYATDNEHQRGVVDEKLLELSENADFLIIDAQYTPEEYEKKKGWGHGTWVDAIKVAKEANVRKLAIFHHDPEHNDEFLAKLEEEARKSFPNLLFAREGDEFIFPAFEETDFSSTESQEVNEKGELFHKKVNSTLFIEFNNLLVLQRINKDYLTNQDFKDINNVVLDCSVEGEVNKEGLNALHLAISSLRKSNLSVEIKCKDENIRELLILTRFDKIAKLL